MIARRYSLALLLVAAIVSTPAAQAPVPTAPYTVLSRDGRRTLAARVFNGQEMFALDDLARTFELTVREDTAAGGITVTSRNQTIVLTPGQNTASSAGRLIALAAAPVRDGRAWFVPVDFVARALAPIAPSRLEVRRPSRLILVGDIRVPRITGRLDPMGSLVRLTLDVTPPTPHAITQEAGRLFLRFEADGLDAALPSPATTDLVQAVRQVEGAPVVAIDLGPRYASFRMSDSAPDRGAVRTVIDVIAQTTDAPVPVPPQPQEAPPPLPDLTPSTGLRTVVVDPGHGGTDEGAKGPSGTPEKQVTLAVARRLKAVLEARLGVRVILTREADVAMGLDERAALANNNKADLFISLHANASVRPEAAGAEVFYLSLDEYGDAAQQAARTPSDALPVFGGGSRDIELIPWEMAQARYMAQSTALAVAVEGALREHVPMSSRAIQQAPFRVLVGANMPAVLVEMAFITNADQETKLTSDAFQGAIVQALADAVTRFRDARGSSRPGGGPPAGVGR